MGFNNSNVNKLTATKTKHQVKGRLLLNVIVGESATVFQLFTGKDQTLLLRRDTLLVMDLCLHILNGVTRLHPHCDGFTSERLNVTVGESATVLQLFASKD